MKSVFQKYFELCFWIAAILLLAFMPMGVNTFSFCPFHFLGFKFCPGCGLGRSIHLFFNGQFTQSFNMHPFGIPATAILLSRIFQLFKQNILNKKYHEPKHKHSIA